MKIQARDRYVINIDIDIILMSTCIDSFTPSKGTKTSMLWSNSSVIIQDIRTFWLACLIWTCQMSDKFQVFTVTLRICLTSDMSTLSQKSRMSWINTQNNKKLEKNWPLKTQRIKNTRRPAYRVAGFSLLIASS